MKAEPKRCTARGKLVKDTGTGAPTTEKLRDGQLADHYVLCPEDRAKGRVEPLRISYVHVGPPPPKYPLVPVDDAYRAKLNYELDPEWAFFEPYPEGAPERPALGRYWTQAELDNHGCGQVTRMPMACAETYAVDPGFYGSTFCCGCGKYLPVGARGEFVWDDDRTQRVGTRRDRG